MKGLLERFLYFGLVWGYFLKSVGSVREWHPWEWGSEGI